MTPIPQPPNPTINPHCCSLPEPSTAACPRGFACVIPPEMPFDSVCALSSELPPCPASAAARSDAHGSQHLSPVLTNLPVKPCRHWAVNTMKAELCSLPRVHSSCCCGQHGGFPGSPWSCPWPAASASGVKAGPQLTSQRGGIPSLRHLALPSWHHLPWVGRVHGKH